MQIDWMNHKNINIEKFRNCSSFLFAGAFEPQVGSRKEFLFAPLPNHNSNKDDIGVIVQALSDYQTSVYIHVPLRSLDYNMTLLSGSGPQNMSLPRDLVSRVADLADNTVHITADHDIAVVTYNQATSTVDTYNVVPTAYLGQEYFVATYIDSYESYSIGIVMITAWKENTYIQIYPTSSVQYKGVDYHPGDVIYENLRPFESIQLLPTNLNITGTRILSSSPVAVSTGNMCTDVPYDTDACDHLAEQLVPFSKWGMSFTLSPFKGRTAGYLFQIVAGRDDTSVTIGNSSQIYLNEGQVHTMDVISQEMTPVTADKPILVMQYVKGKHADNIDSDPAMNRVIPWKQFVRKATFPVFELISTTAYVSVTTECDNFNLLPVSKNNRPVLVRL